MSKSTSFVLLLGLLFALIASTRSSAGINAYDIPSPPKGGTVCMYYQIQIPVGQLAKLPYYDRDRNIRDAIPYFAEQGVKLTPPDFAHYFPDLKCLIVGASTHTQDTLLFLLD